MVFCGTYWIDTVSFYKPKAEASLASAFIICCKMPTGRLCTAW